MLTHLLKLIWQRKTRHLMLSLELFFTFIVVFAVCAFALRTQQLYDMPLGFAYHQVWSIDVQGQNTVAGGSWKIPYDQLRREISRLPEVESVAFTSHTPYVRSIWQSGYTSPKNKREVDTQLMIVSDGFFDTLDMQLIAGRWFSAQDEGANETPIVVNRRFGEQMFDGEQVIGQIFTEGKAGSAEERRYRVVGMVEEFRNLGELMSPVPFALQRFSTVKAESEGYDGNIPTTIMLKLRDGTTRDFETKLQPVLKSVRSDWTFHVAPLTDLRESMLFEDKIPFIILSVLASFLLLMVAFGLFGVLWQNTTQRIPEFGLRRAIGADSGGIYRQIIGEQWLLSSLAMIIALLFLVQIPITGIMGEALNWLVFGGATVAAMVIIYLMTTVCALYPGWRASRLSPTEALHYE